jgi:hypothetical protein
MAPERVSVNLNSVDAEQLLADIKRVKDPQDPDADTRHRIVVDRSNLSNTTAQVRLYIGEITNLYVRAGQFVLLTHERDERHHLPRLLAIPAKEASLQEALSRHMRFVLAKENGETPIAAPKELLQAILQGDKAGVRVLSDVVAVPVVQPDGTLTLQGYDEASKKYVYLRDLTVDVAEDITQADAAAAAQKILALVKQTPLASNLDRAVWLANILTRLAIDAYDGPSPLFYYMASTAGVGKTLLARLAGVVATGSTIKEWRFPDGNEEEMGKILDTVLIEGTAMFFLDNLRNGRAIESPALDEFITSDLHSGRILGSSRSFTSYLKPVMAITANNATLGADLARRVLVANLDGSLMAGLTKSGYEIADIYQYTRDRWDEYLANALTILVGFLRLDKPERKRHAIKPYGSFEQWGAVVGGAVKWATGEDVSLAVGRGTALDTGAQMELSLLELLLTYAGEGKEIRCCTVLRDLDSDEELQELALRALGTTDKQRAQQKLGLALKTVVGKEIPYTYADGRTVTYMIEKHKSGTSKPYTYFVHAGQSKTNLLFVTVK